MKAAAGDLCWAELSTSRDSDSTGVWNLVWKVLTCAWETKAWERKGTTQAWRPGPALWGIPDLEWQYFYGHTDWTAISQLCGTLPHCGGWTSWQLAAAWTGCDFRVTGWISICICSWLTVVCIYYLWTTCFDSSLICSWLTVVCMYYLWITYFDSSLTKFSIECLTLKIN